MRTIQSDFKYYNANTRNKDVGDCVKRSISLALGIDYDEVSKGLNKIRSKYGYDAYNIPPVFNKYLGQYNLKFTLSSDNQTVQEFADTHSGTWLLLTGRGKQAVEGRSSHMLCVIDGNVYDSWNSLKDIVISQCQVSKDATELAELHPRAIFKEVCIYLLAYVETLEDKYSEYIADIYLTTWNGGDPFYQDNDTTGEIRVKLNVAKDLKYSDYSPRFTYCHDIVLKLNLKLSDVDNAENLKKKAKQKIYDWVYNIQRELKDAEAAEEIAQTNPHRQYQEDLKLIAHLPKWVQPLVREIYYDRWDEYYFLSMDPLPDDRADNVKYFNASTLRSLKNVLEDYRLEIEQQEEDNT